MVHTLNGFENKLRSMRECIDSMLISGCESLGFAHGALLIYTPQYASIIASVGNTTLVTPSHIPVCNSDNIELPKSHHDGHKAFNQWIKQYFVASYFVRGQLHDIGNGVAVMFYFKDKDFDSTSVKNESLHILDSWLASVIHRSEIIDYSNKQGELYEKLQSVANIGTWEVDVINQTITWSSQTRLIHDVADDFKPDLTTAISFYKEGYDRDEITRLVTRALETGKPWRATLRLVTAKGNEVWVQNHGMAEMVDGQCARIFGTFQNVNEAVHLRLEVEARREEVEAALKERDHLLSRMSHELKTPLNGIMGMLEAIKIEHNKDVRGQKTDYALRSAEHLFQLINDVLDYTEIASGRYTLRNTEFCIVTLLNSITTKYVLIGEQKGLQLKVDVFLGSNTRVVGDMDRIRQVIENILSNAVKFTSAGKVYMQAVLRQVYDDVHLLISITDTGEGMSHQTQENLFKPLIHGDKLSLIKGSKTGLGLSIVKQLLDIMGGEISFRSQLSNGSCFDIIIPVSHSLLNKEIQPVDIKDAPLSILVVDDNEINRIVLKSMLEAYNLSSDEAEDGEMALKKAREKQYDIIFMDCAMPVLDGVTATKMILEEALLSDCGRVVAVTANTSEADKQACEAVGMVDFLSKPVDKTAVSSILQTVLAQK